MRHFLKYKAAAIRERIANGESCSEIARDLGVSTTSIYFIRDNAIHAGLGPDVSDMNRQTKTFENVKLLRELGKTMSIVEAAEAMNLSPVTVIKYGRSYGIKFVHKGRGPNGIQVVRKMTRVLKAAGFTAEQIEKFKAHGR